MNPYKPRARVRIYEEVGRGGETAEANPHFWDSWLHQGLFAGVRVELTTNQASQVEFSVVDDSFAFIDQYSRPDGVPQLGVQVWLGFGEKVGNPLFRGLLAGIDRSGANSTLRFYDMGLKMRLEQRTAYHKGTDLEVMRKLAERNGLKFSGPGPKVKGLALKSKKQDAQTDWDFLLQLAGEAGLVVYVRDSTLYAREPARTEEPALTLWPKDVRVVDGVQMQYKTPENVEGRPRLVEARGRRRGGGRLVGRSKEHKRGRVKLVTRGGTATANKAELERRARAKKELDREHAFSLHLVTMMQPNTRADVRDTIELVDAGSLFSSRYLIDAVDHDFAPSKLETGYDLYRDATMN